MTNETNHTRTLLISLVTAALLLAIAAAIATVTNATPTDTLTVDQQAYGNVRLEWATNGVFDEALTKPSAAELDALPDMGEIDFGFMLEEVAAGSVRGYVDLTHSLVYSTEHVVDATLLGEMTQQTMGPEVNGTYNDGSLELLSERLAYTTQSGQLVERQFELKGTGSGGIITGEYRETVWGYGLKPLTVVGDFQLRMVASEQPDVPLSVTGGDVLATNANTLWLVAAVLGISAVATAGLLRRRNG